MKFEIVKAGFKAYIDAGYERNETAEAECNFDGVYDNLGVVEREKRIDSAWDSFYDGDAALCKDEDGILYAVHSAYSTQQGKYVPVIWQKVTERR